MTTVSETNFPNLVHRGKVRDTYSLDDAHLLMVATDRISAFDVVLPTPIPMKGQILAELSAFWFRMTSDTVPNHMIGMADDKAIPRHLVDHPLLSTMPAEILSRAMVIKKAQRIDIECVVRGYITGSAWAEYNKLGTVFDQKMPTGLQEGDKFPELLFTPTTKAETGHDEPMSVSEVVDMVGTDLARLLEQTSFRVYQFAHDYAFDKGIIIADTKMEFGLIEGTLNLIDELLTPDSSRFWDVTGYSPGGSQPNFDKQFVRDWLLHTEWDKESPAPGLPDDVVQKTTERYLAAYKTLTGDQLK